MNFYKNDKNYESHSLVHAICVMSSEEYV